MAEERKIKILIVDDHPMMLTMLRQILKQLGFDNIREAETAEAALEMLAQDDICMVFTDLGLPAMSGLELIQKIRGNRATSALPVIVLSGISEQETVLQALKAGADNFIVKPCSAATIKEKIIQVLSKRAQPAPCPPDAKPCSCP
jgi:two-component system, chemotaxis family, chemotaxis protein CheY